MIERFNDYNILLASRSPRRHDILKETGIRFEVADDIEVDETFPPGLDKFAIPIFLAEKKSSAYPGILNENTILITADTIVWFEGEVIGKPSGVKDAYNILSRLSGNMHEVITGVSLRSGRRKTSFYSCSQVFFSELSHYEINYYIEHFKPFDKAGAYGIQEWIGYIGVEKIHGSYFNIVGLPVHILYRELESFCS